MREIKFRAWDKLAKSMYQVQSLTTYKGADDILCKKDCEIMQYTGLKDENKKEIYEGDIIKWGEKIFVVEWSKTGAYFKGRYTNLGYDLLCNCFRNNEVIGNIYENPELLK